MPVPVNCQRCQIAFMVKPSYKEQSKFCSRACRYPLRMIPCLHCGTVFRVKESRFGQRKYCSRRCSTLAAPDSTGCNNPHWKGGNIEKTCETCSKSFHVAPGSKARFCSQACNSQWQTIRKGPLSPRWGFRKPKPDPPYTYGRSWIPVIDPGIYSSPAVAAIKSDAAAIVRQEIVARKSNVLHKSKRVPCRNCQRVRKVAISSTSLLCTACRMKSQVKKQCSVCGKPKIYASAQKTSLCGKCYGKTLTGALNPHWKGGRTSENRRLRASKEYANWRTAVFERDGYACQQCGAQGNLHAHHIIPFSVSTGSRLDIENGQTLCVPCHHKTDTWLRKVKTWGRHRQQMSFMFAVERQLEALRTPYANACVEECLAELEKHV